MTDHLETPAGPRVLTVSEAVALGTIVSAAQRNAPVALAAENGDVIFGTARSIGDQRGNFAGSNDDVRDCFLRVTTQAGWEAFWLVSELVPKVPAGTFVTDYTP